MQKKRMFGTALILAVMGLLGLFPAQSSRLTQRFSDEKDLDVRDAKRAAVFKEDRVLDLADLKPGMNVAEIGAGDGYFTLMLASRVGSTGIVYANDIKKSALDILAERAARHGFANIRTVLGTDEDPRFPERGLDAAFIIFSFHEFNKPDAMLERLAEKMKTNGRLYIVEFPQARVGGRATDRAAYEPVFRDGPFTLEAVDEKTLDIPEGRAVVYILSLSSRKPSGSGL